MSRSGQQSWDRTDSFTLPKESREGPEPCALHLGDTSLNCPELYGENFSRGERVSEPHLQVSVGSQNGVACENNLSLERRAGLPGKRKMFTSSPSKE